MNELVTGEYIDFFDSKKTRAGMLLSVEGDSVTVRSVGKIYKVPLVDCQGKETRRKYPHGAASGKVVLPNQAMANQSGAASEKVVSSKQTMANQIRTCLDCANTPLDRTRIALKIWEGEGVAPGWYLEKVSNNLKCLLRRQHICKTEGGYLLSQEGRKLLGKGKP